MRLLICGDRNWTDRRPIYAVLRRCGVGDVVIQGGAPGADSIAEQAAVALGLDNECYPAQWGRYGRGAGPIRNQQMLDEGEPDEVYAFHDNVADSKGTADMVRRAKAAGVSTYVVSHG